MNDFEGRLVRQSLSYRLTRKCLPYTNFLHGYGSRQVQAGFTLVELMVVVAVIAILAAIAMPQFLKSADKANKGKQEADIRIIKNAAQLYVIDKNPTDAITVQKLVDEGYLAEHVLTPNKKEYTINRDASTRAISVAGDAEYDTTDD